MGFPHSRGTQEGRRGQKGKNPNLPRFPEVERNNQEGLLSSTFYRYHTGPRIRARGLQLPRQIFRVQSGLHPEGGPTQNDVHHQMGNIRLQSDALQPVQCSRYLPKTHDGHF